ncbi:hypothetical protein N9P80_01295, partial [Porticoccaceae bacterium]|nr:hypothetical protein [Porticoccaceae bacterium]
CSLRMTALCAVTGGAFVLDDQTVQYTGQSAYATVHNKSVAHIHCGTLSSLQTDSDRWESPATFLSSFQQSIDLAMKQWAETD